MVHTFRPGFSLLCFLLAGLYLAPFCVSPLAMICSLFGFPPDIPELLNLRLSGISINLVLRD